jgi:hypothetical protein
MPRIWTTVYMACGASKDGARGTEIWVRLHQRHCAECAGKPYEVLTERDDCGPPAAWKGEESNVRAIGAAHTGITMMVQPRARIAKR